MNHCSHCGVTTNNPKFCSKSCAAKYNNSKRAPRSEESKKKTSSALKGIKRPIPPQYSLVGWCSWCNSLIKNSFRTTCSKECYHKIKSKKQSDRLKTDKEYRKKLGTSKPSFMEDSFSEWIKTNFPNLEFHRQHPLRNEKDMGHYYADFYFPSKRLIIELDGTHHLLSEQVAHDINRDFHITSTHNIQIVRISASEYRMRTRVEEVRELLAGLAGIEPA